MTLNIVICELTEGRLFLAVSEILINVKKKTQRRNKEMTE